MAKIIRDGDLYWPAQLHKMMKKLHKKYKKIGWLAPFYGVGAGYRSGATQPPGQVIGTNQPGSTVASPAYPGAGGINAPGVPAGANSGMGPSMSSYEGENPVLSESKNRKISGDELEAVSYYFTLSNMGLGNERTDSTVLKHGKDMKKLAGVLYSELASYAESDEMWDDFMKEKKHWEKLAKKGDDYVVKTWDSLVATGSRNMKESYDKKKKDLASKNKCTVCGKPGNIVQGGTWAGSICKKCSDKGWHMDPMGTIHGPDDDPAKAYESIDEAKDDKWLLKKVKNPKTGNMVQVRSLTPKEQEKYRPKSEKKFELDKKVIKAFAKRNKLGDWTTRGKDTLLNKDTGEKFKVKSVDDVVKIMSNAPSNSDIKMSKFVKSKKPYKSQVSKKENVIPDSANSAIEGLKNDMWSDYDSLDGVGSQDSLKYWKGLAELSIERAADEDEALAKILDDDPKAFDRFVDHYAKKWKKSN